MNVIEPRPIQSPEALTDSGDSSVNAFNKFIQDHLLHNFIVNVLDGGFFGAALGFASFITVIPLFVSSLTDSAILIGLIPAFHTVGWHLPQILTANQVSRLRRFKPLLLVLTLNERLPFFGLAIVALASMSLSVKTTLILTFGVLVWQGLGGGFTGTAWQSLIAKIIPSRRLGLFFGVQAAAANLLASLSAIGAGFILEEFPIPQGFTYCFFLAGILMLVSMGFLSLSREPSSPISQMSSQSNRKFLKNLASILQEDTNFCWFLVARSFFQLAMMAIAFYTVYVVRDLGVSESTVGIMTGILMAIEVIANPIMGWFGDRHGHRMVLEFGAFIAAMSALIAWFAPIPLWFYIVFALIGIANVTAWTTAMAMTLEFGTEAKRPIYIGLANTLVAPSAILAPLIGGWLADHSGYPTTFLVSAIFGLITAVIFRVKVKNPLPEHRLVSKP
mgnify:CR=1 FL=1